jgi:hypothetical protein
MMRTWLVCGVLNFHTSSYGLSIAITAALERVVKSLLPGDGPWPIPDNLLILIDIIHVHVGIL